MTGAIDQFTWARGVSLADIMTVGHPTDVLKLAKLGSTSGSKEAGNAYRKLYVQWLRDRGTCRESEETLFERLQCLADPSLLSPFGKFSSFEGVQSYFYAVGEFTEWESQVRALKNAIKGDKYHFTKDSEREAAAEFAKQVNNKTLKNQADANKTDLATQAELAIEHYKRTMHAATAGAVEKFGRAGEIDPDAYGELTSQAVPLLDAAHSKLLTAEAKLRDTVGDYKDRRGAEEDLIDAFNKFVEAVNGELDSMAQAAGICVTCAQNHLIREQTANFNSAHAEVGLGLAFLKAGIGTLAATASTFVPIFGPLIGAGLQLASIAITEGIKYNTVRSDSKELEKIRETVGQSYRTDDQQQQRQLVLETVAQALGVGVPEARRKIAEAKELDNADFEKLKKFAEDNGLKGPEEIKKKLERLKAEGEAVDELLEDLEKMETAHQVMEIIHSLMETAHLALDTIYKALDLATATKALWEHGLQIAHGALAGAGYALVVAGLIVDLASWRAAQDKFLQANFTADEMDVLTSTVNDAMADQLGHGLFDTKRIVVYGKSDDGFVVGFIMPSGDVIKGNWSTAMRRFSPYNRKPINDRLMALAQENASKITGEHGLFVHPLEKAVVDWGGVTISDDEAPTGMYLDGLRVTVKREEPGTQHMRDGEYEFKRVILSWEGELHWAHGISQRRFVPSAPAVVPLPGGSVNHADVKDRLKQKNLVAGEK